MNQLLFWVEANGLNKFLYDFFFVLGTIVVFIYFLMNTKRYNVGLGKSVLFFVIVYAVGEAWNFLLFWALSGFKQFGGNNFVRVFPWIPLFAFFVSKWLKLDFRRMCDFISPILCLNHGVSHLGCIFAGCCHGYPWSHGVYNHVLKYYTFPIQPIEALVALAISAFIIHREKKKNYAPDGLSFPLMLMLFGYSRFFLEFARDNEKLFLGISELAIWALISGIVGTVWYVTAQERNRKSAVKRRK